MTADEPLSDDEDDDLSRIEQIVMPADFMMMGLAVFYRAQRITRSCHATNVQRFKKHFGVKPTVCATIWEDLQTNTDHGLDPWGEPLLPVTGNKLKPRYFLMALHHLKRYPTELEREGPWDISLKKGREWVRFYMLRLQALKNVKVVWPDNWGDDLWVITVDGTHVWVEEPIHPEWSQDSKYFSHKHGKAGVNYELGIAIATSKLVWMNGPWFKAGTNDITIFKDHGLKARLLAAGKKAIGDRGYTGHTDAVSFYNRFDSRPVMKFKSRALKRHETFNNMTKRYRILRGPFRHGVDGFATAFEAVCVLCQYQLEYDEPLFDVLIEDVLREE